MFYLFLNITSQKSISLKPLGEDLSFVVQTVGPKRHFFAQYTKVALCKKRDFLMYMQGISN